VNPQKIPSLSVTPTISVEAALPPPEVIPQFARRVSFLDIMGA